MSETKARSMSTTRITWMRRATQALMLVVLGQWSFYGIFRCPYLVPFVNCETCPVITCWGRITAYFWGFWLILLLSAVFIGRAFCSWICPAGLVNQVIAKVSLLKSNIRKSYAKVLSYSGFIAAVAVVLVLWFGLNNPRSIPPIRVGEFWSAVALSFTHATPYWLVRTIVVLAIVAGGFIVGNLWCRFACPTGGLLELIRRFSVFRIYKTDACNDCDRCLKVCEMKTRPDEINCTNCGDCIGSCPVEAIEIGRKRA